MRKTYSNQIPLPFSPLTTSSEGPPHLIAKNRQGRIFIVQHRSAVTQGLGFSIWSDGPPPSTTVPLNRLVRLARECIEPILMQILPRSVLLRHATGADPAFYLGGGRKIGEGSGDRLGPQRVQGSALVGGPGGEAPRELLHFDVLGTQFHGSKARQRPCRGSSILMFWGPNFMAQKHVKYFVIRQFWVCFASHHRLALCYLWSANFRGGAYASLNPPLNTQ
jgi:hypothetical protein